MLKFVDPLLCFMILITLIIIHMCLKLFTYVGVEAGLTTTLQEIPLSPFR